MSFTPFPNEIYTTCSFFGVIMCTIPLPCHFKAWNVGTCLLMFWAGIGCLIFFVNSIVWHGNVLNSAPIWCDICIRFIVGTYVGLPASALCINRRLYLLQSDPSANLVLTRSDKTRSLTIDLGISLGLPILFMILHHVHQRYRFDILEDIGCYPDSYNTWVTVLLLNVPPILIGLVSATYGICAIISIVKKRNQFNELLARRLNITSSLYFRLMCFAGMEALTTTPISIYFLVMDLTRWPLYPWTTWKNSHAGVHIVGQMSATVWHNSPFASSFELTRWIHVISAFQFFIVFGFAEETRSRYRLIINFFLKLTTIRLGRQTANLGLHTRPRSSMSQQQQTFGNKIPCRADFPTMLTISNRRDSGGEQYSPSGTTLSGTQDYADGHCMASQTGPGSSGNALTNPRVPAAVEQDKERMPSMRTTQNLRLFDFAHHTVSSPHIAHLSEMDIATIEEGRPSNANRHSSNHVSRPFRSFLDLE